MSTVRVFYTDDCLSEFIYSRSADLYNCKLHYRRNVSMLENIRVHGDDHKAGGIPRVSRGIISIFICTH